MQIRSGSGNIIHEVGGAEEFIFRMIPAALSNVPFHSDTNNITRFVADQFPLHLAVHEVSAVLSPPEKYTLPHLHLDSDEVNIIFSSKKLIYQIEIGGEEHIVQNNSAIWIPRGMMHSANVIEGEGYFVTMRIASPLKIDHTSAIGKQ